MTAMNAVRAVLVVGTMLGICILMKANADSLTFTGVWATLFLLVYMYYEND